MLGANAPRQKRQNETTPALQPNPVAVAGLVHDRERHRQFEFVAKEQQFLEQRVRIAGNADEDAEGQVVVDDCLTDIEDIRVAFAEGPRECRGDARTVRTSDMDEHNLAHPGSIPPPGPFGCPLHPPN